MGKETQQAKTYQERMGFKDKDLGTSKHDEIVLWLLKQENIRNVLKKLGILSLHVPNFNGGNNLSWDWENGKIIEDNLKFIEEYNLIIDRYSQTIPEEINKIKEKYEQHREYYTKQNKPVVSWYDNNHEESEKEEKIKEINKKILESKKYLQGYIDNKDNMIPKEYHEYYEYIKENGYKFKLESEFAILSGSYNLGFIDIRVILKEKIYKGIFFSDYLYLRRREEDHTEINNIYIEVKSNMPTFGEIVREINYYKSHLNNKPINPNEYSSHPQLQKNIYIVVAPECNFVEQLKDQGILFYKYEGD